MDADEDVLQLEIDLLKNLDVCQSPGYDHDCGHADEG